ncbi:POK7 protein, partial [Dicrurus megarhynchus]|nr:POK7 protein [Dicrurus megarhynchus]
LVEGNAVVDTLMMMTTVPNQITQAKLSHEFYHQNAKALSKQFDLTFSQARQIVHSCPNCARLTPLPTALGANPRGLGVNEVWQMDVTHVSSFGTLKYVHVSVDTYSKFFCCLCL